MSTRSFFPCTLALAVVPLALSLACASGKKLGTSAGTYTVDTLTMGRTDGKSIEQMFAGKFPGVHVAPTDGGGLKIRIRGGTSTFYGGEEPLYVVDGTPLPQGNGGVVFLNPHDIRDIKVLKNPEDVGVYGVRGGNGVILITTKRPGPQPRP